MKTITFCLILISTTFLSCTKNDNDNSITTSQLNSTLTTGTWRITYYWDTDHEETTNYTGYSFTFNSNNTLTAVKATTTLTGTWATGTDDSKVKLILGFSAPAIFIDISDDWHVTERTNTKIKLQDVSGGGSGTDFLTFEKN